MQLFRKNFGPIGSIAIQGLGLGLGLLSSILLARLLGAVGFGIYGVAYSIIVLLAMPLHTGLAMLLVKEIAGLKARHDHSRIHGIVNAANRTVIVLSLFAAGVIAAWAMLARGVVADRYQPTMIVALLLLPPLSFGSIRGGILRGIDSPIMGQLPDSVIRPAILVVTLAVAGILKNTISPQFAMGLHVAAAVAGMTFGAIVIRHLMPLAVWTAPPVYEWRSWRNAWLPLSAVAGIQALSASIATLALAMHRTPEEIAYYRVAELGASVVAMPLGAVAIFASGKVAHLFSIGDKTALQGQLRHFARIVFLSACALSLPMVFFGDKLLGLGFGHEYESAWTPLIILCVAQITNAAAGLTGISMTMAGQYRETVSALLVALIVQVVLSFILVPSLGAIGAAIASATGIVVWSQILFWRGKHLLSVSTSII